MPSGSLFGTYTNVNCTCGGERRFCRTVHDNPDCSDSPKYTFFTFTYGQCSYITSSSFGPHDRFRSCELPPLQDAIYDFDSHADTEEVNCSSSSILVLTFSTFRNAKKIYGKKLRSAGTMHALLQLETLSLFVRKVTLKVRMAWFSIAVTAHASATIPRIISKLFSNFQHLAMCCSLKANIHKSPFSASKFLKGTVNLEGSEDNDKNDFGRTKLIIIATTVSVGVVVVLGVVFFNLWYFGCFKSESNLGNDTTNKTEDGAAAEPMGIKEDIEENKEQVTIAEGGLRGSLQSIGSVASIASAV